VVTLRRRNISSGSDGTYQDGEDPLDEFQDVSVPPGGFTNVLVYTVPSGRTLYLSAAYASGENLGRYELLINGVVKDRRRTWWGGSFNVSFDLSISGRLGLPVLAGQQVVIRARHENLQSGIFDGKLLGMLKS
jgi:hypothetical protein